MSIAAKSIVDSPDSSKGLRRKAAKLALGLVFIALLINSLFGDRGVLHVLTQQRRAGELARDVADLRRENVRLAREIEALRSDPRTLERLAREELGLVAPGETTFLIRQPNQSDGN
jgi:cell division protein FtsB